MREITSHEINSVSGGSFLGDIIGGNITLPVSSALIGSFIGASIGGIVDNLYGSLTGIKTNNEANAGSKLGKWYWIYC